MSIKFELLIKAYIKTMISAGFGQATEEYAKFAFSNLLNNTTIKRRTP